MSALHWHAWARIILHLLLDRTSVIEAADVGGWLPNLVRPHRAARANCTIGARRLLLQHNGYPSNSGRCQPRRSGCVRIVKVVVAVGFLRSTLPRDAGGYLPTTINASTAVAARNAKPPRARSVDSWFQGIYAGMLRVSGMRTEVPWIAPGAAPPRRRLPEDPLRPIVDQRPPDRRRR